MAVASVKAKVVPPSPPPVFAELLRRSRFASYDPAVAQTYSAPPAYARRGNYGLKRAIPMPYRDSYISLPTFEHHAHFTDWNNAEQQVKLIKRMEEMNVSAHPQLRSGWYRSLGDAQHQWCIDSEFASWGVPEPESKPGTPKAPPPPVSAGTTDDLSSFGKLGPHQYGARRPSPDHNAVQLNFDSLSPKQFQRYLSQIRELGPEFRAYLNKQYKSRRGARLAAAETEEARSELARDLPNRDLDDPEDFLLLVAAQNPLHKLHRRFITTQFSKNFARKKIDDTSTSTAASKIDAQPHRNGGLHYHHPSQLHSILTSSPSPGILLQEHPKSAGQFNSPNNSYRMKRFGVDGLVLLGDFIARLPTGKTEGLQPLYFPNSTKGIATTDPLQPATADNTSAARSKPDFANSVATFRVNKFFIDRFPKVVSYKNQNLRPHQLLNEIKIVAEVFPDKPWKERNTHNPHKPGSPYYISHISTEQSHYADIYGSNNSIALGTQMNPRSRDIRGESARRHRILTQATEQTEQTRTKIDEMGMGMDLKRYSTPEHSTRLTDALKNMIHTRKEIGEDEDVNVDDDVDDEKW